MWIINVLTHDAAWQWTTTVNRFTDTSNLVDVNPAWNIIVFKELFQFPRVSIAKSILNSSRLTSVRRKFWIDPAVTQENIFGPRLVLRNTHAHTQPQHRDSCVLKRNDENKLTFSLVAFVK